MNISIYFIVLVIIIILILIVRKRHEKKNLSNVSILNNFQIKYKAKESIMSRSESAFFLELQKQFSQDYYIFPKIRVADILDIPNGHEYYKMRNLALPRHVDFVVCNKYFKPLVAIELNGESHNKIKQQESDLIKKGIFEDCGLTLETVNVGSNFVSSITEIKNHLINIA